MNSGPTLSIGSTGPDVRRLQIILVETKLLDVSGIDSNFGPKTRDAVNRSNRETILRRMGWSDPRLGKRFLQTRNAKAGARIERTRRLRIAKGAEGV